MKTNLHIKGFILLFLGIVPCGFSTGQTLDAFLDNGTVKVGVNGTDYGGAIVWLSTSGGVNLVNNDDKGRQIQQSYYAGDAVSATNQNSNYNPWQWNPIMVGDSFQHVSPVLIMNTTGGRIYVKTQPYLWDRDGQLSQSYMEHWISLHPTMPGVVVVDNRLTCFRDANDEWDNPIMRPQELPAVYLASALDTIKAYTGTSPWQNEPLSTIPNTPPTGTWGNYYPTEPWMACVDGTGFGVGVYTPFAANNRFMAGKAGSERTFDTYAFSTMYMGPIGRYPFDLNTVFSYRYYLIVDNLTNIRTTVYDLRAGLAENAWTGGTNGDWANAGNWAEVVMPPDSGTVRFPGTATRFYTHMSSADRSIERMIFDSSTDHELWMADGNTPASTARTLNLGPGGVEVVTGNHRVMGSGQLNLTASPEINIGGSSSLTVAARISESGDPRDLVKTGSGTLILSGDNTYSGTTTISDGTVALGAADRLSNSSTLWVKGGTFDLGGFSDTVATVSMSSGTMTNGVLTGSSYSFSHSGTVSATLAGTGALTKSGPGTLTLGGNNSFSGGIAISGGVLKIAHSNALGSGTKTVTKTASTGGTLELDGSSGDLTLASQISFSVGDG